MFTYLISDPDCLQVFRKDSDSKDGGISLASTAIEEKYEGVITVILLFVEKSVLNYNLISTMFGERDRETDNNDSEKRTFLE